MQTTDKNCLQPSLTALQTENSRLQQQIAELQAAATRQVLKYRALQERYNLTVDDDRLFSYESPAVKTSADKAWSQVHEVYTETVAKTATHQSRYAAMGELQTAVNALWAEMQPVYPTRSRLWVLARKIVVCALRMMIECGRQ